MMKCSRGCTRNVSHIFIVFKLSCHSTNLRFQHPVSLLAFSFHTGLNFINVERTNFSHESCFFGSFFLVTCMYVVKAAEMTFVRKICTFNIDEIDTWTLFLLFNWQKSFFKKRLSKQEEEQNHQNVILLLLFWDESKWKESRFTKLIYLCILQQKGPSME